MSLAAIHPREEPNALRSARPDPCGGQPATAVPTAIASYWGEYGTRGESCLRRLAPKERNADRFSRREFNRRAAHSATL